MRGEPSSHLISRPSPPGAAAPPPESSLTIRPLTLDAAKPGPSTPERRPVAAVWWDGDSVVIIDQRRLPETLVEWRLTTVTDVKDAIATLAVRGAPAIGI